MNRLTNAPQSASPAAETVDPALDEARQYIERLRVLVFELTGDVPEFRHLPAALAELAERYERSVLRASRNSGVVIVPFHDGVAQPANRWLADSGYQIHVDGKPISVHTGPVINADTDVDKQLAAIPPIIPKLLLVPQDSIRDSRIEDALQAAGAGVVQPVIVIDQPEDRIDIDRYLKRWQEASPNAELLEPILVEAPPGTKDRKRRMAEALTEATKRAVAQAPSRARIAEAFKARAARICSPLFERLSHSLEQYRQRVAEAKKTVADRIADTILSDQENVRMQVRSILRAQFLETIPPWAFPYRTVAATLALTAGAWDRVILAMFGWTGQALRAVLKAAGNVTRLGKVQFDWAITVPQQARADVAPQISRALDALKAGLPGSDTTSGDDHHENQQPQFEIVGLTDAVQWCKSRLATAVRASSTGPAVGKVTALLSTAAFWTLFSAPILAWYLDYWEFWRGVVLHGKALDWSKIPVPAFGGLFSAFFLSVLPSVVIALAAMSWAASNSKVQQVIRRLMEQRREACSEMERMIRIDVTNPTLLAVLELDRLVRPYLGHDARAAEPH